MAVMTVVYLVGSKAALKDGRLVVMTAGQTVDEMGIVMVETMASSQVELLAELKVDVMAGRMVGWLVDW